MTIETALTLLVGGAILLTVTCIAIVYRNR